MIAVFGASFATSQAMKAALATASGEPVTLLGMAGQTLKTWAKEKIPAPNTLVGKTVAVLELGGNGVPTAAQVAEADQRLHTTGASKVVWFGYTGWPDARVRDNRVQAAHIVAANVRSFVRLPTPVRTDLGTDGVHPTADGYAKLGRQMAAGIATGDAGAGASMGTAERGPSALGVVLTLGALGAASWVFWKTIR